jgi:leucyl aminopeptidase
MTQIAAITVARRGRVDAELLVIGCFEGESQQLFGEDGGKGGAGGGGLAGMDEAVRRAALRLASRPGWKGREEQSAETTIDDEGRAVSLYGLGPRRDFTFTRLGRLIASLSEAVRVNGVRRLGLLLPLHEQTRGAAAARVLRSLALAGYRFRRYRSDPEVVRLEAIAVVPPVGEEQAYRSALAPALEMARAVAYARDLANTPANEATPAWMEERARELAADCGLELTVLDAAELERRGMGGLLAVGAGSAHPPRLLRLALRGAPAAPHGARRPRLALVGKGVTFDTGGISIKPAAHMEQMKFDKSGACAVLGAMLGAAEMELPLDLAVYAPIAENMINGQAYRPGDIVRCYNGKTVEITNTDAEGRMILADALAWAVEDGAAALVELSTLTGACTVALGHQAAGLFTPDDGFAGELLAAAEASGERLWRLPLYPEFLDDMKSHHADLRNSGERWGSASTAAAFLSQFVGDLRSWAHLDIAGVAHLMAEDQRGSRATGFGVASLLDWLRRRAAAGAVGAEKADEAPEAPETPEDVRVRSATGSA